MSNPSEKRIIEAETRLREFREAHVAQKVTDDLASALAVHCAEAIIAHFTESSACLAPAVQLLCEMSVSDFPHVRRAGIEGLFPQLVERLNDSFDEKQVSLYDRLFADVIEFCRHLPQARNLDEALHRLNLHDAADILHRRQQLQQNNERNAIHLRGNYRIRKFLLPSRVTIGADVAVTSVILAALREMFPQAECVVIGSAKLREIFGGAQQLRIREIAYQRGGSLLERLNSWLDVLAIVEEESRGLAADEIVVIDPDSRLSQLGLLPLLPPQIGESHYYFFASRQAGSATDPRRLGELTAAWINQLSGTDSALFPQLALPAKFSEAGKLLTNALRKGGAQHLVCLSFGVGGNERKRMPDAFERELLCTLAENATLLIDKGFTEAEQRQVNRLAALLRERGRRIAEFSEHQADDFLRAETIRADVVTWQGGIGSFAGLIAASDEYIGYDSAGQHIAAALGVPTLTIFVNSGSPLFAKRWHPHGRGRTNVINVEPENIVREMESVLQRALSIHQQIRNSG